MSHRKSHLKHPKPPLLIGIVVVAAFTTGCGPSLTTEADGSTFRYELIDGKGPLEPWGKAAGDLNGDGRPDLIVGGRAGGGLVWYENPAWEKHVVHADGAFSTDHVVADIDGDGQNDIVSLLYDGPVWFRSPDWQMSRIDDQSLHDIEVSDLNGDGRPDIVGRNQSAFGGGGDTVLLYLQDQEGNWQKASIAVTPGEGLALADIDDDGWDDIVVAALWLQNPGPGHGAEAWRMHRYSRSWSWPHTSIAVHDLNGDSRLDIVLAPSELAGTYYRIAWFEAPADRQSEWREHVVDAEVETVHHFVAVADIDLDGRPDILSAAMHQGTAPHEVKAYLNLGAGEWRKQLVATSGSHNMQVLDIDADGDADLFGANWSGEHQAVELWLNQTCSPDGGCPQWRRHVIDPERPGKAVFVHAADLDGDSHLDVAAGQWWYRNPGHVGGQWTRTSFGAPANNVAWLEDLDGDGDIDALATRWTEERGESGLVLAENAGDGTFRITPLATAGTGDFLQGITSAAFSPAGGQQIALSWHAAGHGIQLLDVADDLQSTNWTLTTISEFSQDEALSAGDIDRDDRIDLLLGTAWLRNEGDGRWRLFHIDSQRPTPDRNRLADINGDGLLDAVVGFEAISTTGDLVWYEQGPDPALPWQRHLIATVVGPMSLDTVDIDGDGDLDIIVGEHNLVQPESARLLVLENLDGQGSTWRERLVYRGDEHHDGALAADVDGDDDLDLVSIGWGHRKVIWYENLAGVQSQTLQSEK